MGHTELVHSAFFPPAPHVFVLLINIRMTLSLKPRAGPQIACRNSTQKKSWLFIYFAYALITLSLEHTTATCFIKHWQILWQLESPISNSYTMGTFCLIQKQLKREKFRRKKGLKVFEVTDRGIYACNLEYI